MAFEVVIQLYYSGAGNRAYRGVKTFLKETFHIKTDKMHRNRPR